MYIGTVQTWLSQRHCTCLRRYLTTQAGPSSGAVHFTPFPILPFPHASMTWQDTSFTVIAIVNEAVTARVTEGISRSTADLCGQSATRSTASDSALRLAVNEPHWAGSNLSHMALDIELAIHNSPWCLDVYSNCHWSKD